MAAVGVAVVIGLRFGGLRRPLMLRGTARLALSLGRRVTVRLPLMTLARRPAVIAVAARALALVAFGLCRLILRGRLRRLIFADWSCDGAAHRRDRLSGEPLDRRDRFGVHRRNQRDGG